MGQHIIPTRRQAVKDPISPRTDIPNLLPYPIDNEQMTLMGIKGNPFWVHP